MKHDYAKEPFERMAANMPDTELAVTISLTIRLHKNGAMSVEGPVQDKAFCKKLLDEAWATINRQTHEKPALIVPGRDVGVQAEEVIAP
jgi:hypothetical protein